MAVPSAASADEDALPEDSPSQLQGPVSASIAEDTAEDIEGTTPTRINSPLGSLGASKAASSEHPPSHTAPAGDSIRPSPDSMGLSASNQIQEKTELSETMHETAIDAASSAPSETSVARNDGVVEQHAISAAEAHQPANPVDEIINEASRDSLPISEGASTRSGEAAAKPQDTQLPGAEGRESVAASDVAAVTDGTSASASATASPLHAHSPRSSKEGGVAYTFSGVQTVLDHSKAAVTALSFGRLDSKLLAFGSDDGCLRVADVGSVVSTILHEMQDHKERIADLVWSHSNDQLISVSEDGLVCVSSQDDGFWTLQRTMHTMSSALCCRFHPVNQNLVLVGTSGSTVEVFNTSTGLAAEGCQAVLTSSGSEGVRAVVMDISRDAVFVGDSSGYIHVLRLLLKKGQLQPLVLLGRVPPPGSRLEPLASLGFTAWSEGVKGPALLAAACDDMVAIYRVITERGSRVWIEKGQGMPLTARMGNKVRLELSSKHLMPLSARPIRASWCPTLPSCKPEYIALGGENAAVNVWDISDPGSAAVSAATLQGHAAPVVAVAWSFDETRLASSDVDGTVIVWKREHAELND